MKRRSKVSLSNYKLLSFNLGELVPIMCKEVLPGDTWQHATSALVRFSPLLAPVMHPTHVHIRHFFVPYRLIWDGWEDFITGGPDNDDPETFPTMALTNVQSSQGTLADFLGVPEAEASESITVSALPIRAYQTIYNEYFRDQDLQTEVVVSKASGVDTTTDRTLRMANWQKDYFTVARPWAQKGAAVTIPDSIVARANNAAEARLYEAGTNTLETTASALSTTGAGQLTSTTSLLSVDPNGGLIAPGATLQELRARFALLRASEARAMYGSRYTEYLAYLGVRSSDARLQRPEYLGGGKQTIQFSEVLTTADTEVDSEFTPAGSLKGHGIGATRSNRYRRFFEEHGFVVSLMCVRPIAVYGNGLERMWNKRTKEDFWQPEYEHIGQQAILNKEVYARHDNPDGEFGWQDRYEEYRRALHSVAGEFRTSLDYWTLARLFADASEPALNAAFIECVPSERIFADATPDHLQVMVNHSIQARRMISQTANPFVF